MIDLSFIKQKPKEIKMPNNVDYFKLYYLLRKKYPISYLLESLALPKHQDRYYAFGFDPFCVFSSAKNQLKIKGRKIDIDTEADNPYKQLQKLLPKLPAAKTHQGGLIGYFSYETINYFEPKLHLAEHEDFPVFEAGLYLDGLIYDSETAELIYYTFDEDRSQIVLDAINELDTTEVPSKTGKIDYLGHNINQSEFEGHVQAMLAEIKKGNTFQAEVGVKTNYKIRGDKFAIYQHLRQENPSPYMYYLKFSDRELFGASPELVVSCSQGRVLTTPAAGTIIRGDNPAEDLRLARKLLNDPKEKAEHAMLVDMHRNDIAKVCRPGSVKISRLMHLIKFNYVQHIVSDVVGELRGDKDSFDLLASIMPCGVLTGAPKIETIKIIARTENEPRGPYGGGVGRISLNGDCVFAMPIRSLFCAGEKCYSQTCAGIVFDSQPKKEFAEVTAKLEGLEKAIMEVAP